MRKNLQIRMASIVIGLIICQLSYSQNFANNWLLGNFGLKFQNNAVQILPGYGSYPYIGVGIISDKQGNMLFYSDGLKVWNKNHELMPNGEDVFSPTGGTSLKESLVVPKPGSDFLFYLFTVDPPNGDSDSGLYYSIVDMSLNNGLGDVIVKGKKILSNVSNKITAVYHSNKNDVWLITHQYDSNNYISHLITASGLAESPVISSVGNSITSSFDGQLKASPDGKKMACSYDWSQNLDDFDLFDFNASTGVLFNPMSFPLPVSYSGADGLEFSSDATRLFVIQTGSMGESGLYQYDLTGESFDEINNSRVLLNSEDFNSYKQMQLAPNGKIYITKGGGGGGTEHLGVIENPNEYGTNCIVKENGLFLEGGSSFVALTPNFIQNYFFKTSFTFDNTCQAHPVNFYITNDDRLDSARWFFGEGSSSTSLNPEFQYAKAGKYMVRLLAHYPEKTDTIMKQITINPFSKFDLGKDTTVCFGHELSVAEGYKSYLWNTGATTRQIKIEKEGRYKISVENSYGCFSSDSIFVKVVDLPVINMPDSVVIGESASILLYPGEFSNYSWSTGETTSSIDVSNEGWYSVAVKNASGCQSAKSVFVSKTAVQHPEDEAGWKLLNPLPSAHAGRDITFINNQIGFIVNDNEIISTTDGGNTWKVTMEISSGNRIAFKNMIGYVIGNNGSVYKSTHLGHGWSKLNTGFTDNLNSISLIHQDTVLITSNRKLFISNDGGQSWETRNVNVTNIEDSYFTSAKVGHAGCSNGTILKTIDGGLNWRVTSSVGYFPSEINRIYFANKDVGFASRGHNDIIKTTDGGETWKNMPNTSDKIYSYCFLDQQNGFISGEHGVIFKTNDGGSSWDWAGFQNGRYYATSIYSLYFMDSMRGFAVGMSGRIMKTTDGGLNWKDYSPTYGNIMQLNFVTDEIGYGLVENKFIKTTDSGITWINIGAPVKNGNTTQFDFVNENIGYCIDGGRVHKTIDGGKTWFVTNNGMEILDESLYSIDFVNENIGFVSGGYNGDSTFKTIDGGKTWQKINSFSFGQIQFLNSSVGYARNVGSYYNRIYKTTDGGKNWVVTFEINEGINSFHFLDENIGYFVGDNALMHKTYDGGKSWQKLTIPYGYNKRVKFYSKNVGYISDDYAYLYKTINGGASWESVNPPYRVPGIEIFSDKIFIYGSSGLILKNSIDFQPASLWVNPATNITNSSVTLTGNVASNAGKIENIRFEYGDSLLSNEVPLDPDTVSPHTSLDISIGLNNLQPNTTYNYRVIAKYNGVEHSSNILQFTTLPDFQLTMGYMYSVSSNDADLSGYIISNKGDITNIEFQFGTDTLFSQSIAATPGIVTGGTSEGIWGKLTLLKPETKYFTRIKAMHEGVVIFSPIVSFTTKFEYKINVYTPYINGNRANLSAYIIAYKDTIKNIVLEYDTSRSYKNVVKMTPDHVNQNSAEIFQTELTNLDINTVYFYRIKANMGSDTIFSRENILRISGGVIIIPMEVQKISDSAVRLQGLINADGKYLYYIQFEYGTTNEFGDSIFSTPFYSMGRVTNTVQSTLTGLAPDTKYHFRIKATDGTNMYYSEVFTYTTGVETGIVINNNFEEVRVYPNPANDYLNIKSTYPIEKVEFMDLNGRVLFVTTNENLLNISNYPAGMYFVEVCTKKGTVIRKIIKQ
jgi:photosystem II stability/assembly factor-like uncharacterized protein